jgi:pimeloyl-ACP methyl ester carboxylesterase
VESFQRDGLVFPVRDAGPRDGDVVVLLHGFPQSNATFDEVVPRLHDAGLRTLAPLQRGYAPTARPAGRRAYATQEAADDVVALLDAAGVERAHLVGHDWGGIAAWAVAGRHRDRVASLTALSVPHTGAVQDVALRSTQLLRLSYFLVAQLPVLPEAALHRTLGRALRSTGVPEQFVTAYTAAMAEPGALTGALNWYRGVPFSKPVRASRAPTTFVWGERDPAVSRAAAEATARWVEAPYRFVELPAGHWLPETRPTEVADAVLERVGSAR